MESPQHVNSHHRETLAQIFNHPAGHNIEWHDVLSLLNAVGTVKETHRGHLEVAVGDVTEILEPTRRKDLDAEQLAVVRRLLRKTGYGPEGASE